MIYHIVPEEEYLKSAAGEYYIPNNFNDFGFVHCAFDVSVVAVADDYYSKVKDKLLLLKINPERLKSDVRYEEAVPEKGSGTGHLNTSSIFPHVYGPVDNEAIEGIGKLGRERGKYSWPVDFISLREYLEANKRRRK